MSLAFDHSNLPQRVLFGADRFADNALIASMALEAQRILLIAGRSAAHRADRLSDVLPVTARIEDVAQHVPLERAREAINLAEAAKSDVVVSVGGGSATGLAKAVALATGLPIIAIPTTFAGSEATNIWGQTEGSEKRTGTDLRVLPRVVVYDASLTMDLPPQFVSSSGLNAIAHAIDSFWAPRADPISEAVGVEALRALFPALRAIVAAPAALEPRESALIGTYLSGVSFSAAGSGIHHKICHVLGGTYDLPHAETHAVVLPYVMGLNAVEAAGSAARVADALGVTDAAQGLREYARELGAPSSLSDIGLREADLPRVVDLCLAVVPASNPRRVERSDMDSLIRAAWEGGSPN